MVCYSISSTCGRDKEKRASLILEDGTEFKGYVFGAPVSFPGEVGKPTPYSFYVCMYI